MWYSKGTSAIADFVRLDSIRYSNDWQTLSFDVPEGTRHFAVRAVHARNNSADCPLLMVDNIRYLPLDREARLLGYNVYRDGARVNTEAVTAPTYLDRKMRQGSYRYRVSALYTLGESRPTAEISVTHTSVESLDDDTAEVVAESWYTIDGLKVARPAARDGQLYVVMRRYADGSARTFRIRN